MYNILENFYTNILPKNEGFEEEQKSWTKILPMLLAIVTLQILILFVGKYLWNTYLVEYVTIVKPVDSVLDLFAIMIILNILRIG